MTQNRRAYFYIPLAHCHDSSYSFCLILSKCFLTRLAGCPQSRLRSILVSPACLSRTVRDHQVALSFYRAPHWTLFTALTHSQWRKFNCYLDLFFLLLIGCVESNPGPMDNCMTHVMISHANINSITAPGKLQELETFVETHDISVLALSETKLDDSVNPALYSLSNFHPPLTKHRNRHGGGTAIYIHSSLPFTRLSELELPGEEWIWVKIKIKNLTFLLCSVYLPPHLSAERQQDFIDRLTDSVTLAQADSSNILVTGDLNVGNLFLGSTIHRHSGLTPFDLKLKDAADTLDLTQLITHPTRIENDVHNLRDLFFTSNTDIIKDSGVLSSFSTLDHLPIYTTLHARCKLLDERHITEYWDYKNMNTDGLTQQLLHTDWDTILNKSMDEATADFTAAILDAARRNIPTKRFKTKQDKPWVTAELRRQIRKRDRLFRIAKTCKTDNHAWTRWRTQRNAVTNLNRRLYDKHIHNKVTTLLHYKHEPYKYHKILKELNGRKQTTNIPPLVQQNGTILTDDIDKAIAFNDHFAAQTFLDITKAQETSLQNYMTQDREPVPTLDHIEITPFEVLKALNRLDVNKSSGPDQLPTKIIKLTALLIYEPLTQLFNKSLTSGIYPSAWKHAKVRPIFKRKGSPSQINNYRPISLLPCFSKIFGKIIFSHIYNHITENSLLSDRQSGYRPGHNTQLQLCYLTEKLYKSLDKGQDFTTIYLDISRYFEKIWHLGLLAKCEKEFGLTGNLLLWVESYLVDRRQTVHINDKKSRVQTLDAGVPQGSVLGPLLAILYLNGLSDKTTNDMLFYADDCSIFTAHSLTDNFHNAKFTLQQDLDTIHQYGQTWAITFNATKTTQQTFSRRVTPHTLNVTFGGQPIPTVPDHKHLGLTLSTDLRFHAHVNDTLLKFNRAISPLYCISKYLPKHILASVYKTYVQPFLDYCDAIYDGHLTVHDSLRLDRAQNRAARLITGTPLRTSTEGLRHELGWTTLSDRRLIHRLDFYHKLKFDARVPTFIKSTLPQTREQIIPRTLRRLDTHTLPFTRTSAYYRSFIPSTTRSWNNLPEPVRTSINYKTFKKHIRERLGSHLPPPYYFLGTRIGNLLHTKLRLKASKLNAHLFTIQKSDTSACPCGFPSETTEHFILTCPLYQTQRDALFQTLTRLLITDFSALSRSEQMDIIIHGEHLSRGVDSLVASAFHHFLESTQRL